MTDRKQQITNEYFREMQAHLDQLKNGQVDKMLSLKEIAGKLYIHPRHLTNTVKAVTGKSPCDHFENKIISIAKILLEQEQQSITDIALKLTYDPSNFTKFFKKYTGQTPSQYRKKILTAAKI